MGSLNFECPLPEVLTDIPDITCPEKFGQVQKLAIRQKQTAATPTFATAADIVDKTKWTAAMAATDDTKIVITPFIASFLIPQGVPVTEGGNDNTTVNGITLLSGLQNVLVTGRFLNLPSAIAKVMRSFTQYSALTPGFTNLEAAFFNESDQIIYELDGTLPTFFPIYNFVLSSVGTEGLNKPNVTNLQFEMLGSWDTNLAVANPLKATTPWRPLQL